MAHELLSQATVTFADVMKALEFTESTDLALPSLANYRRSDTPPRRRMVGKQPRPVIQERHEHSYSAVEEWMRYSPNRGALVEQLYKREGWQRLLRLSGAKSELRRKMGSLTPEEIARLIIKMDQSPV